MGAPGSPAPEPSGSPSCWPGRDGPSGATPARWPGRTSSARSTWPTSTRPTTSTGTTRTTTCGRPSWPGTRPTHYGVACKRDDLRDPARRSAVQRPPDHARRPRPGDRAPCGPRWWSCPTTTSRGWPSSSCSTCARPAGHVEVLAFDSARYVGARIGIHNPAGKKVGAVSHVRNTEYVLVAGDRGRVRRMVDAVAIGGAGPGRGPAGPAPRCRVRPPARAGLTGRRTPLPTWSGTGAGPRRAHDRQDEGTDLHGSTRRTHRDHHRGRSRHRPRARPAVRLRGGQGGGQRPRRCGGRVGRRPVARPSRSSTRSPPSGGRAVANADDVVRLGGRPAPRRHGRGGLRRPPRARQQRRDPARPGAGQHVRGGLGLGDPRPPEGPLRPHPARRRLLAASRPRQGKEVKAAVINTSSTSGLLGNPGQSNYGAAKAGIAAFTVIAAEELVRYGVRVNAIAPAARTRMTEQTPGLSDIVQAPRDAAAVRQLGPGQRLAPGGLPGHRVVPGHRPGVLRPGRPGPPVPAVDDDRRPSTRTTVGPWPSCRRRCTGSGAEWSPVRPDPSAPAATRPSGADEVRSAEALLERHRTPAPRAASSVPWPVLFRHRIHRRLAALRPVPVVGAVDRAGRAALGQHHLHRLRGGAAPGGPRAAHLGLDPHLDVHRAAAGLRGGRPGAGQARGPAGLPPALPAGACRAPRSAWC